MELLSLRTINVLKYVRKEIDGKNIMVKEKVGSAFFHQFGVNYEECETGFGNYSTAIIEYLDGKVENIAVELIKFTK